MNGMKITNVIRIQGIDEDNELEQLKKIQKTFCLAFDRFENAIREIEVVFNDINGPKGGIDKSCRVQLRIFPRGILTAKSSGSSYLEAANLASDKIKALLLKRMSKKKSHPRVDYGQGVIT